MILLMYSEGTGAVPVRCAWRFCDHAVDVHDAYVLDCKIHGRAENAEYVHVLRSIGSMLEAGLAANRWAVLESLKMRFAQACQTHPDEAMQCLRPLQDIVLHLPLQPRTFRDFYAFEAHVKASRSRRGLDMVPEWYKQPVFYFSHPLAFVGPNASVCQPRHTQELDFELEMACVIGKQGADISVSEADDYIAGYAVLNDFSARDIQRNEMKVGLGPAKGKDFATAMGPYLVTPSELADVALLSDSGLRHNLSMQARINGRTVSSGNAKDVYFTFAEMVARASEAVMLLPGEVIGSGTVGTGCILELGTEVVPWLQAGDVVELEIERLGILQTKIVTDLIL